MNRKRAPRKWKNQEVMHAERKNDRAICFQRQNLSSPTYEVPTARVVAAAAVEPVAKPEAKSSAIESRKKDYHFYDQLTKERRIGVGSTEASDTTSFDSDVDRKLPALPNHKIERGQRKSAIPLLSNNYHNHNIEITGKDEKLCDDRDFINREYVTSSMWTPPSRRIEPCDSTTQPSYFFIESSPYKSFSDDHERSINISHRDDHKDHFYHKSAIETINDSHRQSTPAANNYIEQDAKLALELSRELQAYPDTIAMDEEYARQLQENDKPPSPTTNELDVALALKLMHEEHKTSNDTSSDEALAKKLSMEINISQTDGDELFARQLSQQETPLPPPAPKLCPEQLQILERIQQDKERELIQQALRKSSLEDLPAFQDKQIDESLDFPYKVNEQAHINSQESAMREWSEIQRSRNDIYQRKHLQPGENRYCNSENEFARLRSFQTSPPPQHGINSNTYEVNSFSRKVSSSMIGNSSDPNAYEVISGENSNVSKFPGGREQSLSSTRTEAAASSSTGARTRAQYAIQKNDTREYIRNENDHRRENRDLIRSQANADLLRRGNNETRTAIETGRAHVVICQGCGKRLHAPVDYSLVYCPNCNTISPGLSANDSQSHNDPYSRPSTYQH